MGVSTLETPPRPVGADVPSPPGGGSALRICWRALWTSRLVVLATGTLAVLQLGLVRGYQSYDPAGLTKPFGYFGNLLAAPFARWDSVWYLTIARFGYDHQPARTAFYPLYPLLIKVVGFALRSDLVAGVVVSLVCFAIGLVTLYRLVSLEFDEERARLTVMLIAFAPMAYFFSAVYTESLFLALTVGCFYQARRGRWARACALGGLAAASRNTGILLVVPLLILYLWGPREDLATASVGRIARASAWGARMHWGRALKPRYPVRLSLAWVLLVPAGAGAFVLFLALTSGNGLAPFGVEHLWYRHFSWPWGGVWQGAVAAWDGARQLIHGPPPPTYFKLAGGNALSVAGQNLMEFGFLIAGLLACVGVLRTLPFAYGAYVLVALAATLSYPVKPQPLASLPRYELVLFPFFIWAAGWVRRRGFGPQTIAIGAVLLGFFTAEFATWHFVA